jgi:hypothetical protein
MGECFLSGVHLEHPGGGSELPAIYFVKGFSGNLESAA